MKTSSCKGKGRRFQKDIVTILRHKYKLDIDESGAISDDCYNGDIAARLMGGAGVDIIMSPAAQSIIPFDIECKNVEKINIWSCLNQAEHNAKRIPLLVFKRNRSKTYACIELDKLLELMKNDEFIKKGRAMGKTVLWNE